MQLPAIIQFVPAQQAGAMNMADAYALSRASWRCHHQHRNAGKRGALNEAPPPARHPISPQIDRRPLDRGRAASTMPRQADMLRAISKSISVWEAARRRHGRSGSARRAHAAARPVR